MQAARIIRRLSTAATGALIAGSLAVVPATTAIASGQDITVASSAGSANLSALSGPLQSLGADPATEISTATFIENGSAQATKPATGAPTVAPNPTGSQLATSTSATGFDGINHRDQRLAGTGKYANTQFSLEPPDQALCVGNAFVVESVNTALEVFDTRGHSLAGPVAINQLFGLTPEINRATGVRGDFTSDPKCLFDKATNRFFLTVLQIDTVPATGRLANHSKLLIAVTKTGDPTGTWNFFTIDTTGTGHTDCPCFGDQPLIGFDKTGFFISTNEFPIHVPGFNGAQLYAMSKSKLAHGISPSVVHFDTGAISTPDLGGVWYSLQPAVPATSSRGGDSGSDEGEGRGGGTEYFVGALDFNSTLDNRLVVFNLTNTESLNRATPSLGLSHRVIRSETYGQPPVATQKEGPPGSRPFGAALGGLPLPTLNSNDDRMNQVVLANGRLWSGVNTVIGSGASARVGIAWFAINPNGEDDGARVDDQGYVVAPGRENVMFPSIGVGNAGPVMVFTISGPNHFPSAAIKRLRDDSSIEIVAAGAGPDDGFTGYADFGGPPGRWGDYSAATTAPDGSVWLATEYITPRARTVFANWGTFIIHVTGEHEGSE